ncbi:MAG: glycosyltransferase family 2 protein [bacterium]|nr:glycosyltransferase family 2 protein [bacterium]
MSKLGLSAVVLTKNEEKNLPVCLKSIEWVDEIIVVDDESIDKTLEIAKHGKAVIYKRKLDDFSSQRNFALSKVQTNWVLFLDPDEEVTPELAKEIQKAIKTDAFDAYRFPRKNIIFGKWIEHSGWYPDFQTHLFKKAKGKYVEKVHEQVEIEGKIGDLTSPFLHHNYDSISHYLEKGMRYTTLEAENKLDKGYKFVWQDLISKPLSEFLRRFFAEEGFKDGVHGLALSLLQSYLELLVYVKIWEKEGFKESEVSGVFQEIDGATKELDFWVAQRSKSPLRKILHKLR